MRQLNRAELYGLLEAGEINGKRVELLGGRLVVKVREGNRHGATRELLKRTLEEVLGPGHWVRQCGTLDLSDADVLDPDIAVIVGSYHDPEPDNPSTALLVIEVSDRTLAFDRTAKLAAYAAARIADYWIVNLPERQVEVYRDPRPAERGYGVMMVLRPGDGIAPLVRPGEVIPVERLFV